MNKIEVTKASKRRHGEGGIDCRGSDTYRLRFRKDRLRISETFHGTLSQAAHRLRMIIAASKARNHRDIIKQQYFCDDSSKVAIFQKSREIIPDNYNQMLDLLETMCIWIGLDISVKDFAEKFGLSRRQATNFHHCIKKFNPEIIKAVKDTHKKWKVTYDAVRELGINI